MQEFQFITDKLTGRALVCKTCCVGCLYLHQYKPNVFFHEYYDPKVWENAYFSFPEMVGRLRSLCDYDIFDDPIEKTSFNVIGTYKGNTFTLYDYKGDHNIHIGGYKGKLDVSELIRILADNIKKTQPCTYEAYIKWTGTTYKFP